MNLAVVTSSSSVAVFDTNTRKSAAFSFKDFRALAKLQPPDVAARLARLARGVEYSIRHGDPERYRRARWLEEAVAQIVQRRPKNAESLELQQCLTRLLRQSFRSLDWRRSLMAGCRPTRRRVATKKPPLSSATS